MHFQNPQAFVCFTVGGGNCNCNGDAYTFSDIDDVEAQLLKPGNGNGVKAMTRVIPNTAQGVENISVIFSARSNASTALESIVSIGDVAPGEAQGNSNSWIGIRGAFTRTFAHWRHVSQRNPRHEGTREEFHEGTREESRSRRSPLAATSVVRAPTPSRPIRYGGSTRRAGHSTRGPPPLAAARRARARCRCALKRWVRTAGRAAAAVVAAARRAADTLGRALRGRGGMRGSDAR